MDGHSSTHLGAAIAALRCVGPGKCRQRWTRLMQGLPPGSDTPVTMTQTLIPTARCASGLTSALDPSVPDRAPTPAQC